MLLPEMRHMAIYVYTYCVSGGVITRSQPLSYSHSPRAIIPRDKCNLHIICRVSSKDHLRATFVALRSRRDRNVREQVSVHLHPRSRRVEEREKERDETRFFRSLLGKSRGGTVNRVARIIHYVISIRGAISNVKHLNGTLTSRFHEKPRAANRYYTGAANRAPIITNHRQ